MESNFNEIFSPADRLFGKTIGKAASLCPILIYSVSCTIVETKNVVEKALEISCSKDAKLLFKREIDYCSNAFAGDMNSVDAHLEYCEKGKERLAFDGQGINKPIPVYTAFYRSEDRYREFDYTPNAYVEGFRFSPTKRSWDIFVDSEAFSADQYELIANCLEANLQKIDGHFKPFRNYTPIDGLAGESVFPHVSSIVYKRYYTAYGMGCFESSMQPYLPVRTIGKSNFIRRITYG